MGKQFEGRGGKPKFGGRKPGGFGVGGARGKALILLHARKDRLWAMGGETRPPRPRLLRENLNGKDAIDRKSTNRKVKASMGVRRTFEDTGILKGLLRGGEYLFRTN